MENARLVVCPKCNIRINSVTLRMESPKCDLNHDLGTWYNCDNATESHVFLTLDGSKCPYCGNSPKQKMTDGMRVKCLHVTAEGMACTSRPFAWIKEGPPCFMNHVSKMRIES